MSAPFPGLLPPGTDPGDRVAREFLHHRDRLVRTLARITGCVPTAEDLSQEAYLRVQASAERQAVEHVGAFLFQTGRNLAIDHLRARDRGSRIEGLLAGEGEGHADEGFGCTRPEAQADCSLMLRRLEKALRRMPERRRRIFVLHRLHGVDQKDIAGRLGVSLSTVEKELRKALNSCLRELPE